MMMTAGRAAIEALRDSGVTTVFGLMGSSTLDMYDALYDAENITYIGVRDERAGVHMADAYGRISGRPGVMIAGQSGPGSSNLVTGLAQSKLAYSPVVVVTGLPLTRHIGKDSFQEIDQHTLFLPVAKRVFNVPSSTRIPEFISNAMRIANSGRKGPVVLNIARDLFAEQIDYEPEVCAHPAIVAGYVSPDELVESKKLLLDAKTPVMIVGAGVKWGRGHAEVIRLAEKLNLPMVASSGHGDVVPNDHPLYFGYAGPAPYANQVARTIVQEADVILALGTRLGFNTTLYGHQVIPKSARIVQVDIDADAIGKYYPVHQGIVGDATRFARCLADSIELDAKSTRANSVNSVQRTQELQRRRDSLWVERSQSAKKITSLLTPEQIFSDLRAVLPREVIVTLDSGTLCRQAADQLQYFCPPALLTPLDFGLVGFGYSAGLGAKVAAPHRPVVSLSGDGGFGMTMIEICTAVQSKINTVGIVLDNECWGSEKAYQRDFYDRRYIGDGLVNPRYDHVAQSCGATGFFVSERGQLADAVSQGFKASEPVVIHIKVDPEATVSSRKDALKHRGGEEKGR